MQSHLFGIGGITHVRFEAKLYACIQSPLQIPPRPKKERSDSPLLNVLRPTPWAICMTASKNGTRALRNMALHKTNASVMDHSPYQAATGQTLGRMAASSKVSAMQAYVKYQKLLLKLLHREAHMIGDFKLQDEAFERDRMSAVLLRRPEMC